MAYSAHVKEEGEIEPETAVKVEEGPKPAADVKKERVTETYNYVCRLCDNDFKENKQIACEHLTFCRSCLEKYYLSDSMVQVCTRCSGVSDRGNQQWDSQQDILSLMHLRAKSKRGNCGDRAVHLLCQELNEVLNLSGTKPCPKRCMTCPMVTLTEEDTTGLTGPDGNIEFGPNANTVIGPNGKSVVVEGKFTCKSKNVIYFIYCRRPECGQAYVGQTTLTLQLRMTEHRKRINNQPTTLVAKHFNLPDHTMNDCKVCVIKGFPADKEKLEVLLDEEVRLITFLGTKRPNGLNMNS